MNFRIIIVYRSKVYHDFTSLFGRNNSWGTSGIKYWLFLLAQFHKVILFLTGGFYRKPYSTEHIREKKNYSKYSAGVNTPVKLKRETDKRKEEIFMPELINFQSHPLTYFENLPDLCQHCSLEQRAVFPLSALFSLADYDILYFSLKHQAEA